MTVSFAPRARFAVEALEGRAMMSATLAAPVPEPAELRYELENVIITSYQTSGAGTHALYQDVFIPANQSGTGAGGGAGKVQMQDIFFGPSAQPAPGRGGEIEIESFSWGETSLPAMTDLAGVDVDGDQKGQKTAGYDLKAARRV